MSVSGLKENFMQALGLRPLTEHEKMLRSNADTSNEAPTSSLPKTRKRPLRKTKQSNGVKNQMFHFSLNRKQGKQMKTNRGNEVNSPSPKKKTETSVNTSSVLFNTVSARSIISSSPQLPSNPQNVILLPPQNKGQQNIQAQPSIVLGQTIFQGPDGKKFILIPSTTSKQSSPGVVQMPKTQTRSPTHTPILPLSGAMKTNASAEVASPQGYLYLPHGHSVLASHNNPTASVVTNVTNVLPGNKVIVSPAQKPGVTQQSNIMQLLNMTKTALNETQFPVSSINFGVWPQCTNQAVQIMKIKSPDVINKDASPALAASVSKASAMNIPGVSLALIPNAVNTQQAVDVSKAEKNLNAASVVMSKATEIIGTVVSPVAKSPISTQFQMFQSRIPISPSNKVSDNQCTAAFAVSDTGVAAAQSGNGAIRKKTESENDVTSAVKPDVKLKRTGRYLGDPNQNVLNPETNCVVIQGKKRKRKGEVRSFDSRQYRRYGGPPFVPCKPPPAPNTPSSGTCCLYEHTLLKMATRGFWGCEMGQLQDVFRSIRCESIDLDTVEDVTKRCYGFVRRKIIDAGEDSKSMYRYMKNYIDEFDSFLDRVYPVAVIAILLYLPTAADYSLVTWHGIPPTGWSEYRRAVVMREVFEVVYRFGTELNIVPEYQKEFFDNSLKSPLLVPRVFDLRQSYADPTTCFVQKVPQPEKTGSNAKAKSVSRSSLESDRTSRESDRTSRESDRTLRESDRTSRESDRTSRESDGTSRESDRTSRESDRTSRESVITNNDCHRIASPDAIFERLTESELTGAIQESPPANDWPMKKLLRVDAKASLRSFGNEIGQAEEGKLSHDEDVNKCQKEGSVNIKERQSQNVVLNEDNHFEMTIEPRKCSTHEPGIDDYEDDDEMEKLIFPRGVSAEERNSTLPKTMPYNCPDSSSRDLARGIMIAESSEGRMSPVFEGNTNEITHLDSQGKNDIEAGDLSSNGARLGKAERRPGADRQVVISAGFAESIVAACENNQPWLQNKKQQRNMRNENVADVDDDDDVVHDSVRVGIGRGETESSLMTEPPAIKNPEILEGVVSTRSLHTFTTTFVETRPLTEMRPEVNDAETRQTSALLHEMNTTAQSSTKFADLSNEIVCETRVYSDHESSSSNETIANHHRRRTSRRIASSTRFDLHVASDDFTLERDLRKAIKLSKQESIVGGKPDDVTPTIEHAPQTKKTDKIPLKISRKPFEIRVPGIENDSENPIKKLRKVNRSVAFEALWTQMSVEEPSVILDGKTYSLGEFLEKFPVETHCPPDRTVMKVYNREYDARDILGYLRRGTQLVEQVDNEVVIDTTRTVKANATILAVRKVPPGKISKLVHPDLHLENYTGFLLPIGIRQPVKGKRGHGRAAGRSRRKSSLSKEEFSIKSEPASPSLCNSPYQQSEETSPPPQKLFRLQSKEDEKITEKRDIGTEINVKTECKEVQTDDQLDTTPQRIWEKMKITDADSLEKALNSVLETAMVGLAESDVLIADRNKSDDVFRSLIVSYERAGNFLLNTAKMLGNLRNSNVQSTENNPS